MIRVDSLEACDSLAIVMNGLRPPVDAHGWQDVVVVFPASFVLLALIGVSIYQLEVSRYHRCVAWCRRDRALACIASRLEIIHTR
ncbi:MAG: hypothetical protein ABI120_12015 [Gemmatimonadaceae bacterium]